MIRSVNIVNYEKGMKVEYPDAYYKGNAELAGLWIDKDSFSLDCVCPDGFDVVDSELIPTQKYYLRGKVSYKERWYVYTAKVDLRSFDENDYQELLNAVFEFIKQGGKT